jgi:hypothetical protein
VEDSGADGKENMKYRIKTVGEKKRTRARGAASLSRSSRLFDYSKRKATLSRSLAQARLQPTP